jgi:hypothetical protein
MESSGTGPAVAGTNSGRLVFASGQRGAPPRACLSECRCRGRHEPVGKPSAASCHAADLWRFEFWVRKRNQ